MRKVWLVFLTGVVSGLWAASLTVLLFGFIPTLLAVFLSGFLSGSLGLATVLAIEKALKRNAK